MNALARLLVSHPQTSTPFRAQKGCKTALFPSEKLLTTDTTALTSGHSNIGFRTLRPHVNHTGNTKIVSYDSLCPLRDFPIHVWTSYSVHRSPQPTIALSENAYLSLQSEGHTPLSLPIFFVQLTTTPTHHLAILVHYLGKITPRCENLNYGSPVSSYNTTLPL